MAINKVIYGDETLMDITDTTASVDNVVEGNVFYNASGTRSVGNLSDATQNSHGLMSINDKIKLDGIAENATNNIGTITGITMNNVSKGTSGVVDLGTVITSHQDISGKVSGPSSATNNAVAIFDGTTGKVIKNSGFTIGKSVPSNAIFTDTTYNNATTETSGLMSSDDKIKLNGIAAGATANVGTITGITMNGVSKGTNGVIDLGTVLTSHQDISNKLNASLKGAANGLAELDNNGKVPTSQLPSYVDDVIEGYLYNSKFYKESAHTTEITGETGKIYVDLSTEKTYRWSSTAFVEISASLALGTTSSTAFRGDYGNSAYTHAVTNKGSAFTNGLYKITTNSEGHVTVATEVVKSDITELGIPAQDTTYESKTAAQNGTDLSLVTTGEKYAWNNKSNLTLGTSSSNAYRGDYGNSAYTHAVTNKGSAFTSGLYKITTNSEGHVTSATAVIKDDITSLGIPEQDTTYSSLAGVSNGSDVSLVTTGEKYKWNLRAGADTDGGAANTIKITKTTTTNNTATLKYLYYGGLNTTTPTGYSAEAQSSLYVYNTFSNNEINSVWFNIGYSTIKGGLSLHSDSGKYANLSTASLSNNRTYIFPDSNGNVVLGNTRVWYGTCATAATTAKKAATVTGLDSLQIGDIIYITFTYAQTYNGAPTMQINSAYPATAANIRRATGTNAARYEWVAGETIQFIWNGTYFLINDGGLATTTYYGVTKLYTGAASTNTGYALTPASLNSYSEKVVTGLPAYSSSATYAVGDRVRYSTSIWECNTAITTAESWTAEHWTEMPSLLEMIEDITDLPAVTSADNGKVLMVVNGAWAAVSLPSATGVSF